MPKWWSKITKKDPSRIAAPSADQTNPKDLFSSRGEDFLQNGEYSAAVLMYTEALKCAPTDSTLLISRSLAHLMSTPPSIDLALQDADAAIQADPTNWRAWSQRGETLLKKRDTKGAEEALVNAVDFAKGLDKVNVRKSLAELRTRLPTPLAPLLHPQPVMPTGSSPEVTASTVPKPPTAEPLSKPQNASTVPSTSTIPLQSPEPNQGGSSHNTPSQPERPSPITRPDDFSSVSQAPASSVPLRPEDLIDLTSETPPSYTPNFTNSDPTVRALSLQTLTTQLNELQTALAVKNKGSVSIRPYTATGYIDAVKLIYVGMTLSQLTDRELGTPTFLHPSFRTMTVNALNYPGTTFLDMDCESSEFYDGNLPGTVSISGYSEEYREFQLSKTPMLVLALEGTVTLPTMETDKIVERIQSLQRRAAPTDNTALRDILGLSQLSTLQAGWYTTGGAQRQIEAICMALTRSLYDAPTRFIDFSKARNFSNNLFGITGIGLRNFLFQVLLGAELFIRLRKEPVTTSYAGLMTDAISSLVVLSDLWMQNVTIQSRSATTTASTTTTTIPPTPNYILVAVQHQRQAEGLIRFGEALSWPYMDEARNYIENAYHTLIRNSALVGYDMCDWLYGLILPGKIYRHRIMCCLVYASPSIRSIHMAPFWDNGLVVKNKSYWPKRSVLGRVLGGLKNPKSVCGWIGPVPAPNGSFSGWIRLSARRVDIPVPVNTAQSSLQSIGFGQPDATESPEATLQSITDPNQWIQACPPSRPPNDSDKSSLKAIHLTEKPSVIVPTAGATDTGKEYSVSLEFEVNSTLIRYTLYSNPVFVYAPPCVGTHTMHTRQAQNYLGSIVRVANLKDAYPPSDSLVIVDAMGQGEEVVARAWCAERGRHAVVRRDGECCFACAVGVTIGKTGMGFNVLIWSR